MSENRYRGNTPPDGRSYGPRSSMVISSSFDPHYSQSHRSGDSLSQTRHGSIYDTQAVKRRTYLGDGLSGAGSYSTRTEYAVRPRNNSFMTGEQRRPLSTLITSNSPPRNRPLVSNGSRDIHQSPASYTPRDEASRYLVPASSQGRHHNRHYSATRAEAPRQGSGRPRSEYHQPGGYSQTSYPIPRQSLRDEDYSYTGPREQFDRDYPTRPPPPRESHSREPPARNNRPYSVIELTDDKQIPFRRDTTPSVVRQFDRGDKSRIVEMEPDRQNGVPRRTQSTRGPVVHQHRDEDYSSARDDYDYDSQYHGRSRRETYEDDDRVQRPRPRDYDKISDRDREYVRERDRERERELDKNRDRDRNHERDIDRDRDRDRDRERERERDRERDRDRVRDRERDKEREKEKEKDRDRETAKSYERGSRNNVSERREEKKNADNPEHASGLTKGLAAVGLGGVAAGLTGAAIKKIRKEDDASDYDQDRKERKHRKHRSHDQDGPVEEREDKSRDDGTRAGRQTEISDSESPDNEGRERRRRHRHKHSERLAADSEYPEDPRGSPGRKSEQQQEDEDVESDRRRRRGQQEMRIRDQEPSGFEQRTVSPGEDEDDRPRRVQLVEPVKDKEDVKPKGILKPARQVPFPEDPNPTREGVAPLKDAGKDGIPQNARWTKINRLLVNPEALISAHERFEERDDYVIVLRVLSREEIQKLSEKTKEIRGKH